MYRTPQLYGPKDALTGSLVTELGLLLLRMQDYEVAEELLRYVGMRSVGNSSLNPGLPHHRCQG